MGGCMHAFYDLKTRRLAQKYGRCPSFKFSLTEFPNIRFQFVNSLCLKWIPVIKNFAGLYYIFNIFNEYNYINEMELN